METCRSHGMTDIVMVHEHRGEPDGLVVSHLPYGPTAYFGLFNVVSIPAFHGLELFSMLRSNLHSAEHVSTVLNYWRQQ